MGMQEHVFVLRSHMGKGHDTCVHLLASFRVWGQGVCVQRGGRKGRESKWGKMLPQPKPTTANTLHVVKVFAKLCLFYNAYLLGFFF